MGKACDVVDDNNKTSLTMVVTGTYRVMDDKGYVDLGNEYEPTFITPNVDQLQEMLKTTHKFEDSLEGQRIVLYATFPDIKISEKV